MIQKNMVQQNFGITRIGIFMDGGYFSHVSNFYRFHHETRSYLSLPGLKEYIRHQVTQLEEQDISRCQIVDAHYFRGRLSARECLERNTLYGERVFEDALLYAGFESHHQPVSQGKERGIDVMFALEAFDCASRKGLDVCVLIAGDGDFIPLVRKLHGLGTRVMVVGFNVQAVGVDGSPVTTRCSFHLMQEATYPLMLSEEIARTPLAEDPLLASLFLPKHHEEPAADINDFTPPQAVECAPSAHRWSGHICHLDDSYGFLLRDGDEKRFFFFKTDLMDLRYEDLHDGQAVSFVPAENERGPCAKRICKA